MAAAARHEAQHPAARPPPPASSLTLRSASASRWPWRGRYLNVSTRARGGRASRRWPWPFRQRRQHEAQQRQLAPASAPPPRPQHRRCCECHIPFGPSRPRRLPPRVAEWDAEEVLEGGGGGENVSSRTKTELGLGLGSTSAGIRTPARHMPKEGRARGGLMIVCAAAAVASLFSSGATGVALRWGHPRGLSEI